MGGNYFSKIRASPKTCPTIKRKLIWEPIKQNVFHRFLGLQLKSLVRRSNVFLRCFGSMAEERSRTPVGRHKFPKPNPIDEHVPKAPMASSRMYPPRFINKDHVPKLSETTELDGPASNHQACGEASDGPVQSPIIVKLPASESASQSPIIVKLPASESASYSHNPIQVQLRSSKPTSTKTNTPSASQASTSQASSQQTNKNKHEDKLSQDKPAKDKPAQAIHEAAAAHQSLHRRPPGKRAIHVIDSMPSEEDDAGLDKIFGSGLQSLQCQKESCKSMSFNVVVADLEECPHRGKLMVYIRCVNCGCCMPEVCWD
jgi:hypothetical protein